MKDDNTLSHGDLQQIRSEINEINNRISQLEIKIIDTKKRLPAHSVKPMIMNELLEYEDMYDLLLSERETLKKRIDND